jgi:hypothetical protein
VHPHGHHAPPPQRESGRGVQVPVDAEHVGDVGVGAEDALDAEHVVGRDYDVDGVILDAGRRGEHDVLLGRPVAEGGVEVADGGLERGL